MLKVIKASKEVSSLECVGEVGCNNNPYRYYVIYSAINMKLSDVDHVFVHLKHPPLQSTAIYLNNQDLK